MAFSGVHVVMNYGVIPNRGENANAGKMRWSETMLAEGMTALRATPSSGGESSFFSIYTSDDIYISIGPNPNAAISPRRFVPAGELWNEPCVDGDRLAWVLA